MSTYQIADRGGDLRKYRTEIPNSIDDLDLSVYAFRLYVHLKRVAGDVGTCWQSTDTLAKACKMSKGMVSKAKDELIAASLIRIEEQKLERGGRAAHHITITDIWLENFIKYAGHEPSSYSELASSPHEQASSPHEIKKEPIKKEYIVARKTRAPNPLSNHPAILCVKGITNRYPPKANYQKVIGILGDKPDGERAASCYEEWTFRGYNGNALGWLDWYVNGIPTRGGKQNGNGHGAPNAQIKQAPAKQDEGKGMYL